MGFDPNYRIPNPFPLSMVWNSRRDLQSADTSNQVKPGSKRRSKKLPPSPEPQYDLLKLGAQSSRISPPEPQYDLLKLGSQSSRISPPEPQYDLLKLGSQSSRISPPEPQYDLLKLGSQSRSSPPEPQYDLLKLGSQSRSSPPEPQYDLLKLGSQSRIFPPEFKNPVSRPPSVGTSAFSMPAIPMPAVSKPAPSRHTPRAFMPPATKNPSVTTPAETSSVASRPIPCMSALGPADKENMVPKTTGIPMPAIPMPAVSRPLASQHTPRAFMPPATKNPSVTTPADTNSVASRPIPHKSALGPADKENMVPKTTGIPMPAIPMPAVSRPLASQHTPRAFMPPATKNPSVTTPADTNSVASRPIPHKSALGPADKENMVPKTTGIPMPTIPMPAVSRLAASQHTPRAFMPPATKNPSVTTPADTNSVASRPISHMSALGPADKENLMPKTSIQDPDFAQIPPPSSHQTTLKKRPLSDLVNPEERPAKHQKHAATSATSAVDLPPPQEMPVFVDDGTKPQFSYATLIGMAILRAPNRRLTLAQIYKWISDSFAYYQIAETGWQNSIRHNLSLNKAFIKQERPKNDPGKGNYWAIEPGMEGQFLKDKQSRRTNATSVLPAKRNVGKPVALAMAPQNESVPELSPNATIGTSAADHSTPKAMHSSPPVGLQEALAEITPLIGDYIAYPNYEDGAEQLATLHDSGYWSSAINASAMAVSPGHGATLNPVVLTDPLDMDSGRAEGAIARNRVRTQECLSGAPRALSPEPPRTPVNQIADDGWHDRWNRGWNRPDHFSSPASHISISSTETPVKQAADAETGPNPPEAGCRSPRWEDYLDLPEEEAYAMHLESIRELVPSPAPLFARLPEDPLSEFIIWDDGAANEYDVRMALF